MFLASVISVVIAVVSIFLNYRVSSDERDLARIQSVLSLSLKNRSAAEGLDDEWPKLAGVLLEHVENGVLDRTTLLWLRSTQPIPICSYRKVGLFSSRKADVCFHEIRTLDYSDTSVREKVEGLGIRHLSRIYACLEDNSSIVKGEHVQMLGTLASGLAAASMSFDLQDLSTEPPKIERSQILVRVITETYLGCEIFTDTNHTSKLEFGSSCTHMGEASELTFRVVNAQSLLPCTPALVDTVHDTLDIILFDEYTPAYPAAVTDPTLVNSVYRVSFPVKFK